jgi:hypothetical protein
MTSGGGDLGPTSEKGTLTPNSRDETIVAGHGQEGGKELEAQQPAADADFPEGGLRAWGVVLGVYATIFWL